MRPPAALTLRRKFHRPGEALRIVERVDHRCDHAAGAGIEQARGGGEITDRDTRKHRLAGGGDERQRPQGLREINGPVLHVEGDEVEILLRQQGRYRGLRNAAPGAQERFAGIEAFAQCSDRGHGCFLPLKAVLGAGQTTRRAMLPSPSIEAVMVSPRATAPTPAGVPEKMTSPGITSK